MRNELAFSHFIASLGCPMRSVYDWSAVSNDGKRVILTVWSDELKDGRYELWPSVDPLPEWTNRQGAKKWYHHVEHARASSSEILGILCHPRFPLTNPKKRHYYDEKSLLVLTIEDTDEGAFARVVGEVSADDVRRGPIQGYVQTQHDALADLFDSVPEGAEIPERQPSVGTGFRRDPMIRAYVLKRAKGHCECCGEAGFLMANGHLYLEAHHILSLSASGPDTVSNVVALCPRHHREAHFGAEADALNAEMQQIVEQKRQRSIGHVFIHTQLDDSMSRLLVGFDSAWTADNAGGLVGVVCRNEHDYQDLGPPIPANFVQAEEQIRKWQTAHEPSESILLIDQPTIVRNAQGQRPVENLVSSPVSLRYGGMQPANTGRNGMFDGDAPIWSFLHRFGGPADPCALANPTNVFETYPVLTIVAMGWTLPDIRPKGRLPKYNPVRRKTFQQDDWRYLCAKMAEQFKKTGLERIKGWIDSRTYQRPTKEDQDCLDSCLCLLVAMTFAHGEPCLVVGQQESGAIVVPHSESLAEELHTRCRQTGRDPKEWVKKILLVSCHDGLQRP